MDLFNKRSLGWGFAIAFAGLLASWAHEYGRLIVDLDALIYVPITGFVLGFVAGNILKAHSISNKRKPSH